MVTSYDNFAYHEMISHVPIFAHPHPRKALVIGGGDGGTITEVLKHNCIEEVVLCEIDEEVVNISQKYFPEFASAFADKRLKIVIDDAANYVKTKTNYFDVACIDSSDPTGPAEVLFQGPFYKDIYNALTCDGIACSQSESMYYHQDFIAGLHKQNSKIFPHTAYYYTLIPSYPSGTIGFMFCSKIFGPLENLQTERVLELKKLKYYNYDIHKTSFVLPQFMTEALR